MKRFIILIATALALATAASAQTAQEIVEKMEQQLALGDTEGIAYTFDMRIPLLGTASTRLSYRGDKSRMDINFKDDVKTVWRDKDTTWTYEHNAVTVQIEPKKDDDNDDKMRKGLTDGYKVSVKGETADTWQILCKKDKSNTDKDDPSKKTIFVSKKTFLPVNYPLKKGAFKMTVHDYATGISEEEVTFTPEKVKGATITDKR